MESRQVLEPDRTRIGSSYRRGNLLSPRGIFFSFLISVIDYFPYLRQEDNGEEEKEKQEEAEEDAKEEEQEEQEEEENEEEEEEDSICNLLPNRIQSI